MSNEKDFVIDKGELEAIMGDEIDVVIPDGVKKICGNLRAKNKNIRSVQLPNGVKKIEAYAFYGWQNLEKINIPASVTKIEEGAFWDCKKLTTVVFEGEPERIGVNAFCGCWKLADNPPAPLADYFFRMKEGKLTLEEGKALYHFSKAKGVARILEFENVHNVGDYNDPIYEFSGEENTLIIPVSIGEYNVVKAPVRQVPKNAIVYCSTEHFEKMLTPNKANLAAQWLMGDKMIREEVSEPIKRFIKKYADSVTYALRISDDPAAYKLFLEIAKPKADVVRKLMSMCRDKAEIRAILLEYSGSQKQKPADLSLEAPKMTVAEIKKLWTYSTYIIGETGEKLVELSNYKGGNSRVEIPEFVGKTRVGAVSATFPPTVKRVEFPSENIEIRCSFRKCQAMADSKGFVCVNVGSRCVLTDYVGRKDVDVLAIPKNATENISGTFRDVKCREVILPEGFTKLASFSFSDCSRLQKVTLPESLRTIGILAFQDCCVLSQLYVPAGVTDIALLNSSKSRDKDFIIYGEEGSAAQAYALEHENTFIVGKPDEISMPDFVVKDGSLMYYVGKDVNIVIPKGITNIETTSFCNNSDIKSVVIGEDVEVICSYAFSGCGSLSYVKICGSVKRIEENVFMDTPLEKVEIEEGTTEIGNLAFAYLSRFAAITFKIPASVTKIGTQAFHSHFGNVTLYVKAGSYAENYAKENNIPFVAE